MQVDVQSLRTFNRLAHEGAEAATASLGHMTGIDATVEVTRISLVDRADVGETLDEATYVGVQFEFDGALRGDAVLVFDRDGADRVVDALLSEGTDTDELARSGVSEIGNIMMSGFIDGWADHLQATIDHSPPAYIERTGASVLPEGPATSERDQLFVFRSDIEWRGEAISFYIYLLPAYEPLADLLTDRTDDEADAISLEKLEVFNRMTRAGMETAAENVGMMTDFATQVDRCHLSFAPIEDVPKQVGTETYVGTVVEFTGVPSGYLLILFAEDSARTVAEALMPSPPDGPALTDQHTAAIQELGNIMTSGFVDGWANVLQRSIEHTPPRLVHDMGKAIVDPLAAQLGRTQQHAFLVDSRLSTQDVSLESEVLALPDEAQLQTALDDLLVEREHETTADPEEIFQ